MRWATGYKGWREGCYKVRTDVGFSGNSDALGFNSGTQPVFVNMITSSGPIIVRHGWSI